MSKDKKTDPKAAPKAAAPAGDAGQASANQQGVQVIAQYIKDFSFENPNAPESLVSGWPQPETNVQIFLKHQVLKDDVYECSVNFRVEAKAKEKDKVCFIIDLSYGALVVLKNIPKETTSRSSWWKCRNCSSPSRAKSWRTRPRPAATRLCS